MIAAFLRLIDAYALAPGPVKVIRGVDWHGRGTTFRSLVSLSLLLTLLTVVLSAYIRLTEFGSAILC